MVEGARIRTRIGVALAGALILIGGIVLYMQRRQTQVFFEPANLLARFPAENGSALSIDLKALRNAGLLAPGRGPEEPEYKQFLDGTGLDYRRDLDFVIASFSKSGNYFIARGRFDWNRLHRYAAQQGGSCYENLCRMQGSRPERRISFLPLRNDIIALAVSADDLAATKLLHPGPPVTAHIPTEPVWFSAPGAVLRDADSIPRGLRIVLSGLTRADRVLITAGLAGSVIEAHLETTCRNADDARVLASELRSTTATLKDAVSSDKEASQDELARMLAAGTFDSNGNRVTGKWPIGKGLIENLTAGI